MKGREPRSVLTCPGNLADSRMGWADLPVIPRRAGLRRGIGLSGNTQLKLFSRPHKSYVVANRACRSG